MNPTKAQLKQAFGFSFDTELAGALAISKQAISQQDDDRPVPDAWCWRAFKVRPDIFDDPAAAATVITPKPKPPKSGGAKARLVEKEAA